MKILRSIIKCARNNRARRLFWLVSPLAIWFIFLGSNFHSPIFKLVTLLLIYGIVLSTLVLFKKLKKFLIVRRFLKPFHSFKVILLAISCVILLYTGFLVLAHFLGISKKAVDDVLPLILTFGVLIPIYEEIIFRFIPFVIAGINGLTVYSVIWLLWHPLDRILVGAEILPVFLAFVLCIVQVPVYIKIWRSKYWWMAFVLHSTVNNWLTMCSHVFNLSF